MAERFVGKLKQGDSVIVEKVQGERERRSGPGRLDWWGFLTTDRYLSPDNYTLELSDGRSARILIKTGGSGAVEFDADGTPPSHENTVRSKSPQAEAKYREPMYETGQSRPIEQEHWEILSEGSLGARQLGRGNSKEQAWADAAKKIRQQQS